MGDAEVRTYVDTTEGGATAQIGVRKRSQRSIGIDIAVDRPDVEGLSAPFSQLPARMPEA